MAAYNWQGDCSQPLLQDQRLEDPMALTELSGGGMAELEAEVDAELQAALVAQCQYLLRLDDAEPAAPAPRHQQEFSRRHEEPLDLGLPRQPRSSMSHGRKRSSATATPSAAAVAAVADADAVTVMVLAHSIKRARTSGGGGATAAKAWQTPRTKVASNRGAPTGRPATCIRAVARDLAFTPAAAAAAAGTAEPATAASGNRPPGGPIRAHAAASLREGLSIVVAPFSLVKSLETRRRIDEINANVRESAAGAAAHRAFYARTLGAAEPAALPFGGRRRFGAEAGRLCSAAPA